EQADGSDAGEEKGKVKADVFGDGEEQQIEDDLRNADEHVLRRVDALGGGDFKDEIGKEDESQKERHVFEGAADGLVGVGHFDEGDAEGGGVESGDGIRRALGADTAGGKRD